MNAKVLKSLTKAFCYFIVSQKKLSLLDKQIQNMIQGVIFDMDGTLIDSEPLWRIAEIEAFKEVEINLTEEMLAKYTAGMRNDEVVSFWFNYFEKEDETQLIQVEKTIITKVKALIKIDGKKRALPGLDYIFEFFESRNIPMAVASSSPAEIIEITLEAIGINEKFEIKCSAEFEEFGKPNPAVFITTAKLMNLKPENILVFEDSLNGTLAAKAAKMKCVSLPANHDFERPQFVIADVKLRSLLEFDEVVFLNI